MELSVCSRHVFLKRNKKDGQKKNVEKKIRNINEAATTIIKFFSRAETQHKT